MRMYRRGLAVAVTICALAAAAWAQQKKSADELEGQVRLAALSYFLYGGLGHADKYLEAVRFPLYVVRDGKLTIRDDKDGKAWIVGRAQQAAASFPTDEARGAFAKYALQAFEESSVQYVGANTATVTFMPVAPRKPEDGERLVTLVLYRKDGKWQVVSELSDSTPVPPEYLK
jgi:hypothetical protein